MTTKQEQLGIIKQKLINGLKENREITDNKFQRGFLTQVDRKINLINKFGTAEKIEELSKINKNYKNIIEYAASITRDLTNKQLSNLENSDRIKMNIAVISFNSEYIHFDKKTGQHVKYFRDLLQDAFENEIPDIIVIGIQEANTKMGFSNEQVELFFKELSDNPLLLPTEKSNKIQNAQKYETLSSIYRSYVLVKGLKLGILVKNTIELKPLESSIAMKSIKDNTCQERKSSNKKKHQGIPFMCTYDFITFDQARWTKGMITSQFIAVKDGIEFPLSFTNTHLPFKRIFADQGLKHRTDSLKKLINKYTLDKNISHFIFGDLNFRLNPPVDYHNNELLKNLNENELEVILSDRLNRLNDIVSKLKNGESLSEYDELLPVLKELNWHEGTNRDLPENGPSCKYKCGKEKNSNLSGKFKDLVLIPSVNAKSKKATLDMVDKMTLPSYCDRIIYHDSKTQDIKCTKYIVLDQPKCASDHYPVLACFQITNKDKSNNSNTNTNSWVNVNINADNNTNSNVNKEIAFTVYDMIIKGSQKNGEILGFEYQPTVTNYKGKKGSLRKFAIFEINNSNEILYDGGADPVSTAYTIGKYGDPELVKKIVTSSKSPLDKSNDLTLYAIKLIENNPNILDDVVIFKKEYYEKQKQKGEFIPFLTKHIFNKNKIVNVILTRNKIKQAENYYKAKYNKEQNTINQ